MRLSRSVNDGADAHFRGPDSGGGGLVAQRLRRQADPDCPDRLGERGPRPDDVLPGAAATAGGRVCVRNRGRPRLGCGCFGDFSTTPVSGRTLARSALLAAAALSTIGLHQIRQPGSVGAALQMLVILGVELVVIGVLSPEIGETLIRLGSSQPCELREVPVRRTLTALRRSKQWRRYAGPIVAEDPADVWRELCWRYVVFRAEYEGRPAEVVFAVFLQRRRPAIRAALVDTLSGSPVPFPASSRRRIAIRRLDENLQDGSVPDGDTKAGDPAGHYAVL